MIRNKSDFTNKIHLIISVLIVIPVAIVYGFQPDLVFDIRFNSIDEFNFSKAIMGLYLGFSVLWILGIFKSSFFKAAIITNIVFMLGLGFGRALSIFLDGNPSSIYIFGLIAELFLGFYGVWVLRNSTTSN
ncbi:DUF4345 domain-containing protein [Aureibaculum conchae]|uniref:DUF4345 domain-containing protein n=1 Tax=Aureibaculum sp. 2308TA14-22 TaxID=3108392 RepID=UPI0033910721